MALARTLRRATGHILAVAAVLAFTLACGGDDPEGAPSSTQPPASATAPAPPTAATAVPSAVPSSTPAGGRVGDETVAFATGDGVTIRGHLFANSGPRRKVVVLAHMAGSDQRSWSSFAQELADQGIAVLTFDFRGFGETGGAAAPMGADADLEAAVRFIRSRDYAQVYVAGADMGGTAAIKVAARQELAGLITLSAPVSFMGLDAGADVSLVSEAKLFLASRNDPSQAATSLATLLASAPAPKDSELYDGAAHGTDMLQGATATAVKQRIVAFLSR